MNWREALTNFQKDRWLSGLDRNKFTLCIVTPPLSGHDQKKVGSDAVTTRLAVKNQQERDKVQREIEAELNLALKDPGQGCFGLISDPEKNAKTVVYCPTSPNLQGRLSRLASRQQILHRFITADYRSPKED